MKPRSLKDFSSLAERLNEDPLKFMDEVSTVRFSGVFIKSVHMKITV